MITSPDDGAVNAPGATIEVIGDTNEPQPGLRSACASTDLARRATGGEVSWIGVLVACAFVAEERLSRIVHDLRGAAFPSAVVIASMAARRFP